MHDDRKLIEDRLRRVEAERLPAALHRPTGVELNIEAWHAPGEPVPFAEAVEQEYAPFAIGEAWGRPWGTSWFHVTGTVPRGFKGRRLELVVDLGYTGGPGFTCEGLVHNPDGNTVKGVHPMNRSVPLRDGQTKIDFWIEAAANPDVSAGGFTRPTHLGAWDTAGDEPAFTLRQLEVLELDEDVYHLTRDLEVIGQLMVELPAEGARRWELTAAVSDALDVLDPNDVSGTAAVAREKLAGVLASPANASAHRIAAVGHAHIDSAWLWPLRETVRKVARTVSNVVNLSEEHPDLVFAFSSAQQHAWIKEHHPKVWRKLKKAVSDGVIVPVGGMWVESDTNMVGAEAMCRQFVHGKRFFLDEYGIETDEVWLPDSFGYAAGLPQIVQQSATTYFLTQKISWNQVNKFPHHTFWWEGIDGTRVFTHFPSADTYNSDVLGRELAHAARNCQDKAGGNRSLLPFGFGDGGGGPTREMVERIRRTGNLEGSSAVQLGRPDDFFVAAHEEFGDQAQVWSGELYLEMHRGTYTSQARTKQGNRRSEHLLREAEIWCTTAAVRAGARYPYEDLDRLWKRVLLHQFHDILPGSSIAWVHREAEAAYAEIAKELEELITEAIAALAGDGRTKLIFNAAGHERHGIPALGARKAKSGGKIKTGHSARGWTISNGMVTVKINNSGVLTSVVDHASDDDEFDREVLAGPSNLLQLHIDTPNQWDAWDVDSFYRHNVTDVTEVESITEIDNGVRVARTVGESTIVQTITLEPGAEQVDFAIDVDWHERETMLKAGFLLDIHADRSAAETQFGHVFRPTHTNTSWDAAKFEICAHRYLHLGEEGYGVALVNDSTYGHDVRRVDTDAGTATEARLSLLRSPRFPDPDADQGEHQMRYALVVGAGLTDAVRQGLAINVPERTVTGSGDPVAPLVSIDNDDIVVSAVKLADDGSGDVVVRVHQATGARSWGRLDLGFNAKDVVATDLLERPIGGRKPGASPLTEGPKVAVRHGGVDLELRPFQMITLRFER
ncbi:alpha-mannosidase [Propionibacteriaceae bacterium Y1700]|uniref:alpha-mannosidase n=1 Tax=Microlunatus sp. Y1700 TaxID=3418487 RepID=UPI003DA76CDB